MWGGSGRAVCVSNKGGKKVRKEKEKKATSRYEVTSAIDFFFFFWSLLIFYIKADSLEYFIFLMKREVTFHNFL